MSLRKLCTIVICVLLSAPCAAEDYLIIKKRGGPAQRVPLNFAPEQIESFHVEPGAPGSEKEAPPAEPQKPAAVEKPAQDQGTPLILRKPSAPEGRTAGPKVDAESPGVEAQGAPRSSETPPKPAPRAASPDSQGRQRGILLVNVYKLPENVKTLPDFSAFKPVAVTSADRVNLEPARGDTEPSGLPNIPEGMGLRMMGMFFVSGEGIFRWRVMSKDGVRVHIDDKTLIENDGLHDTSSKDGYTHLAEGMHTIVVDSFNSKGAPTLKLFVEPPTGQEALFSASQGLNGWKEPAKPYDVLWGQVYFVPKGAYPEGPDFSKLSPIGRLIDSELNITGEERIPGIPGRKDMIGIRYQGYFTVQGAGIFAFRLASDNFARLTIGKQSIAEIPSGARLPQGKIGWAFLQQGSYPISLDYFHAQGAPRLELFVTTPTQDEQLFAPAKTLEGFASDTGKLNLIPAFVYFLKPNTTQMPNYNKMSPSGMFFSKAIDFPIDRGTKEFPGVPKRDEWLGLRFYVKFSLSDQEAGLYKFRLATSDSARLIVGKNRVANIEGKGGRLQEQTGTANLPVGSHEMFLDYFHGTGASALQLYITPPGGEEKVFAFQ